MDRNDMHWMHDEHAFHESLVLKVLEGIRGGFQLPIALSGLDSRVFLFCDAMF